MKIYADSSFLVSCLYPGDSHHAKARKFFQRHAADQWLTSGWSQFETANGLRQLCLAAHGPKPVVVESIRRLFKHWHARGPFRVAETDVAEAVNECQQLSAAHATAMRMRSADVLHVALLEQIAPDLFVTRDADQFALATQRAFPAQLID